jgi:hypothetical protein
MYPIKTWMNAISTRAQVLNCPNIVLAAASDSHYHPFPKFAASNKNVKCYIKTRTVMFVASS